MLTRPQATKFFLTSYELLRWSGLSRGSWCLRKCQKRMLNSWARVGLRPIVAQRVEEVYPNYTVTRAQGKFLNALNNYQQLMIRDLPGQGKSFLLAIWALASNRAMRDNELRTTTLILVHTAELAHQYYEWIARIIGDTPVGADEVVQQVSYGPASIETLQDETLLKKPFPHILIATPDRLRLMLNDARFVDKFDFQSLHRIIVDEADQMITFPEDLTMSLSEELYIRTANTPLERLLQHLQHLRKPSSRDGLSAIWCSATLNTKFRLGLILKGWGTVSNDVLKFIGAGKFGGNDLKKTIPEGTSHYVVVVDSGQGLVDAELPKISFEQFVFRKKRQNVEMSSSRITEDAATRSNWKSNAGREITSTYYHAIADILNAEDEALNKALVLVASDEQCTSTIDALRSLGYASERPQLPKLEASCNVLVSTISGARGLNIPHLTHVFHIGPLAETNDYVHCAGKLRRLGQSNGQAKSFILLCVQDNLEETAIRFTKLGLQALPFFISNKEELLDDTARLDIEMPDSKTDEADDTADLARQSEDEDHNDVERHASG